MDNATRQGHLRGHLSNSGAGSVKCHHLWGDSTVAGLESRDTAAQQLEQQAQMGLWVYIRYIVPIYKEPQTVNDAVFRSSCCISAPQNACPLNEVKTTHSPPPAKPPLSSCASAAPRPRPSPPRRPARRAGPARASSPSSSSSAARSGPACPCGCGQACRP